jgi:hypothetical protein
MMKGYRTMIFGFIAALIGLFEAVMPIVLQLLGMPEFQGVLPKEWHPWMILIVAIGTMYFRKITTTPLGKSD